MPSEDSDQQCANAQFDLKLGQVHKSEGTFSDVSAQNDSYRPIIKKDMYIVHVFDFNLLRQRPDKRTISMLRKHAYSNILKILQPKKKKDLKNLRGCLWQQRTHRILQKLAYSNIIKQLPPKDENFQIKISDIFHIPVQNIDCGYSLAPPRRGDSNGYPQSMF